jgi:hypothetical protein
MWYYFRCRDQYILPGWFSTRDMHPLEVHKEREITHTVQYMAGYWIEGIFVEPHPFLYGQGSQALKDSKMRRLLD